VKTSNIYEPAPAYAEAKNRLPTENTPAKANKNFTIREENLLPIEK